MRARLLSAILAFVSCAGAGAASAKPAAPASQIDAAAFKTVDARAGFTLRVPQSWTIGRPSGNNRFEAGAGAGEEFAVVVTGFGPTPGDARAADAAYRASFARNGFVPVEGVGGEGRYAFTFAQGANGEGYAEVRMVSVAGETFSVMVVTRASARAERAPVFAAIFDSIAVTSPAGAGKPATAP